MEHRQNQAPMLYRLTSFLRSELRGWKKAHLLWLAVASAVIIGLSIYWKDTPMGIISATTGVICVICTGKGKLSAYVFGLVNSVLYAIISYRAGLYGETMLNALYYVPMQFVGFYTWSRHMDTATAEVHKRRMRLGGRALLIGAIALATVLYGWLLRVLGDPLPIVDAFTTVASVFAMIVSIRMYAEQWYIWIVVNITSVIMWGIIFARGEDSIATLLMWIIYLFNAIVMCVKWEKDARREERHHAI